MATRSSPLASILPITVVFACTSSHHDMPCPKNQPAFRIELTASEGALPADTMLTVMYSGTEMESYSLAQGGMDNQDVCCRPASPTNGALPDVPCGIPPAVTMEASVHRLARDAGAIHDAAATHSVAGAASKADAATIADASSRIVTSLDAGSSADAGRSTLDASADDSGKRGGNAAAPHASGPAAIVCDLWTNGVATVKVTGTGYAKLSALLDDPFVPDPRCGVETVDHRLVLTHADGGLLK